MSVLRSVAASCLLLLLVAGCTGTPASAPAPTGEASGAFPITVEHGFGTTVVPAAPQRVAALGFGDQDVLLALGIVPVTANQFVPSWTNGVGPWGQSLLKGQQPVPVNGNDLNIEQVLAQQPDLIVAANLNLDQATYDRLSALVPVVAVPKGFEAYSIPWQEHATYIGRAVGKGPESEKLVADTEARVTAAASAHPELAGRSAQVLTALPEVGGTRAYTSTARGYILETLGLDIPAWVDQEAGDGFYVNVPAENVGRLEADVIVFLGSPADLRAQPLLAQLPAVRRGSVVFLEDDLGVAFAAPGPLTIPYTLDAVVPQVVRAAAASG